VRFRVRPRPWRAAGLSAPFAALAVVAGAEGAAAATALLGTIAAALALRGFADCALATGALRAVWADAASAPRARTAAVRAGAKEAA